MNNPRTRSQGNLFLAVIFLLICAFSTDANGQTNTPLRRPISPSQPAYLIHIDTWNYADPQKIIDLIPEDIRPYVVMNISLSISHNVATSRFQVAEYGYEIARSWLTITAQNQMWAIVQHSSGGFAQFSDTDLTVYEEFYNDFPNLIGFNYAEQFWGFDDATDPLSPKWTDRIAHFANLLELSDRFGGYLVVSWCGNQWSQSINPIGMLKRNPAFARASEKYSKNYLLFEKYTQQSYQSDMESLCLGAYLSGYCGNYGIRYDDTGWTDVNGNHANFSMATAGAVHLEHMMLTGQTMLDGPELIWTQCFRETNRKPTTDGYAMRDWETFPQFINVTVDIFRKILDGTVRIPTRQEVIDRTKFVVIQDVSTGSADDIYSTPATLFEGLYRMDGDGNLQNNKSFFKKTGRYPTIPTVFNLHNEAANTFEFQVRKTDYSSRWPTIASKVDEFNQVFPKEYTGDLYAGRHENGWVIYNPFKTGQIASTSIPFQYNTTDSVELTFSQYTASVMKEYSDKVTFYLSNHDTELFTGRKTNIIKIYGSTSQPVFTWEDRGDHQGSIVTSDWADGVFTLTLQHNGPLDVTINCAGTATGRLTDFTPALLIEPVKPPVYTGPRQYEAECFDYKHISGITTAGNNGNVRNYTGQGYLRMGTSSQAAVRRKVNALRTGTYQLITRYSVTGGNVTNLDLFVNGVKVATPEFTNTTTLSNWSYNTEIIELNEGDNIIEFIANGPTARNLYLDNIVITEGATAGVYHFDLDVATTEATNPPAKFITTLSGTAGVVEHTNGAGATSNAFKAWSAGSENGTGVVSLDMFNSIAANYSVVWKEYYNTPGGKKGVMLRGTGTAGSCPYAEGLKQGYLFTTKNNEDNTVTLRTYIADDDGITEETTFTTDFSVMPGQPAWFRATVFNDQMVFESSADSINWVGSAATTFTDDKYPLGSTQLVWGLNSDNLDWVMDNISFLSESIIVSRISLDGFRYDQGRGPSAVQAFSVSGSAVSGDMKIASSEGFEISTDPTEGFGESITLSQSNGRIPATSIYVRLQQGLPVQMYEGDISVSLNGIDVRSVKLDGIVAPQATIMKYDFSDDVATTTASTPPAINASIGQGNTATAGVVSYTNTMGETSNMLKPYANGQRNSTGVINLDLFPDNATDYSVTWKQHIGSASTEYKIGVLLRGDPDNIGTATTGYVQGMMYGFLLIAYNNGSATRFSIYRSNATFNNLNVLIHTWVNTLAPAAGQPVWYRASATGSSSVFLTIEYSLDGVTWEMGASVTDNTPPVFATGATQLVWGLAASAVNFWLDDITFKGLHLNSGSLPENLRVSEASLTGFAYNEGHGPSEHQTFMVSGTDLAASVVVEAPYGFEVSLDAQSGFSTSVVIPESNGTVAETTVYVRLKPGLSTRSYSGEITVSSQGSLSLFVDAVGVVNQSVNTDNLSDSAGSLVLYPNPATDELMIQLPYETGGLAAVQIFNTVGAMVKTVGFNGQQANVRIDDLIPGLYVVRVLSNSGQFSGKLLVR